MLGLQAEFHRRESQILRRLRHHQSHAVHQMQAMRKNVPPAENGTAPAENLFNISANISDTGIVSGNGIPYHQMGL